MQLCRQLCRYVCKVMLNGAGRYDNIEKIIYGHILGVDFGYSPRKLIVGYPV